MPSKKDDNKTGGDSIPGFESRETKVLAAAFLATTAPDKYDYELMATLSGYTAGSVRKLFPPIKRKAIEAHPSFGKFLGATANGTEAKTATPKATGKKRKTPSEPEADDAKEELIAESSKNNGTDKKKPAAKKAKMTSGDQDAEDDKNDKEPAKKKPATKKAKAASGDQDAEDGKKKAPAKARGRPKKAKVEDEGENDGTDKEAENDEI